jgi:hypothetical protein
LIVDGVSGRPVERYSSKREEPASEA